MKTFVHNERSQSSEAKKLEHNTYLRFNFKLNKQL